jgi:hypothetical protein
VHKLSIISLLAFNLLASSGFPQTIAPSRVEWRTTLGSEYEDQAGAICETADGGYVLVPRYWYSTNSYGGRDAWLLRFDRKGMLVWSNFFGGSSNDWFQTIIPTRDGGWIAAGGTFSPASGNKTSPTYGDMDYWVVRLDSNGNKLWDQTYGGSRNDQLCGICETTNGGFILAGQSISSTNGNKTAPQIYHSDAWIIGIDANGEILWQKTYGGSGEDRTYSFAPVAAGGYVLAGSFRRLGFPAPVETRPTYGGTDAWIISLDSEGDKVWEQVFGGAEGDEAVHISQTKDGGFIVGGTTGSGASGNKTSPTFGDTDYWVIRLDPEGNKMWEQTFGSTGYDLLCSVQETLDGNFIVAGYSVGAGGNKTAPRRQFVEAWWIRLDAQGGHIWDETYDGLYMTSARSMSVTRDGGFIFAGEEQKGAPSSADILIVKLAPDALTAPLLSGIRLDITAGSVRFKLTGIAGKTYVSESTTDFISWDPFATNTLLTPQIEIQDAVPFGNRFYRARLLP